jgi:hypothetical protein
MLARRSYTQRPSRLFSVAASVPALTRLLMRQIDHAHCANDSKLALRSQQAGAGVSGYASMRSRASATRSVVRSSVTANFSRRAVGICRRSTSVPFWEPTSAEPVARRIRAPFSDDTSSSGTFLASASLARIAPPRRSAFCGRRRPIYNRLQSYLPARYAVTWLPGDRGNERRTGRNEPNRRPVGTDTPNGCGPAGKRLRPRAERRRPAVRTNIHIPAPAWYRRPAPGQVGRRTTRTRLFGIHQAKRKAKGRRDSHDSLRRGLHSELGNVNAFTSRSPSRRAGCPDQLGRSCRRR